jgi:hypothetical protein
VCVVRADAQRKDRPRLHGETKLSKIASVPVDWKNQWRCPGYVIDYVQALKHGGRDAPGNMQWQTAAKAKDKIE